MTKLTIKNQCDELTNLVIENESILKAHRGMIEQYKLEIEGLNSKLNAVENDYANEKKVSTQYRQQLDNCEGEIALLRSNLLTAENNLVIQSETASRNQKQIAELFNQQHVQSEQQILMLKSELSQLHTNLVKSSGNGDVKNMELTIMNLSSSLKHTEAEFAAYKQSSILEINRLTDNLTALNRQLQGAEANVKNLHDTYESELSNLKWQCEDYERDIKQYTDQISSLEVELKNSSGTIDQQLATISNLETSGSSSAFNEVAELKLQLAAKHEEILRSKQETAQYMHNQLDLERADLKDYEDKIGMLSNELEIVTAKLHDALANNAEMKLKSTELPVDSRVEELMCEIEDYKNEVDRLNEVLIFPLIVFELYNVFDLDFGKQSYF